MSPTSRRVSISVVTVTLNAAATLRGLVESLRNQHDHEFTWTVFDGGSSDGTVDIVRNCGLPVKLVVGRDFGIYDALNQCVQRADTDYYLVCGADDVLYPHAIASYRASVERRNDRVDFVAASVDMDHRVLRPREGLGWLLGLPGIASSHAVGLLIRTDLHAEIGWYSRKFPIAADQLFVKTAYRRGCVIARESFVAGRYGTGGTSGSDMLGMLTEAFRVQRLTERGKLLQVLLFILRLLKHYRRV
jgi:glycosyltransferase involved in cell wall biosynthesis